MSPIMLHTKYLRNICRIYSTEALKAEISKHETDKIGPPDPISNLRPVIFAKLRTESELEKIYRKAREETQDWNQDFWARHNTNFIQERKKFKQALQAKGKTSVTSDDMSIFYKAFLDKNWQAHFDYNVGWYKRNIRLLFLDIRCRLSKLKFKRTLTVKS